MTVGGPLDDGNIGATWIFTRSGSIWTQQGLKLIGTGNVGSSRQGRSVSLVGDSLAVGGYGDNGSIGATWIFKRSGSIWTQQGLKLIGTGIAGSSSQQGYSVSLSSDNTLVVGGSGDNKYFGATWVFTFEDYSCFSNTEFVQQGLKLLVTDSTGDSKAGKAVSVSGNTLAVGGWANDSNAGATWIYTRSGFGDDLIQQQKLVGTGAIGLARQGYSVSLSASDGNTLAVGGWANDSNVGATWIYTRSGFGENFTQQQNLVGTGNIGSSRAGWSVSLSSDGNTLAVGGRGDDGNIGATWIFTRTSFGNPFTQQEKLVTTGNIGNSRAGWSVSLSSDGNTLAVGGQLDNSFVGATWIFTRTSFGNPFTQQQKLVATDAIGGTQQGKSISLSENTLAIGGPGNSDSSGATWIFTRTSFGNPFTQQQKLIATGYTGDASQGISVSLAGNTLAVGGSEDNSYNGATWIFTRTSSGNPFIQQGTKLVGTGNTGAAKQGISVSLSSSDSTLAVGGLDDNSDFGATWIFTILEPYPCFLEGTLITTRDGEKEVKDLTSDDYIVDKFSENYKIKSVFCSEIPKNFEKLIYLSKDCFEPNKPNRPIICTKYHRFEINGVQSEAGDLINNQSIYQYRLNTRSKIYHILLEDNEYLWMQVSGVLAESLDPTMVYKDSKFFQ